MLLMILSLLSLLPYLFVSLSVSSENFSIQSTLSSWPSPPLPFHPKTFVFDHQSVPLPHHLLPSVKHHFTPHLFAAASASGTLSS